mmetsp:Transcript_51583/g.121022  ORF Transcript_51583/g.121022 Transcript_51583/m.121022 type:complete len:282 (+) Transcript_51583:397-1242(+)
MHQRLALGAAWLLSSPSYPSQACPPPFLLASFHAPPPSTTTMCKVAQRANAFKQLIPTLPLRAAITCLPACLPSSVCVRPISRSTTLLLFLPFPSTLTTQPLSFPLPLHTFQCTTQPPSHPPSRAKPLLQKSVGVHKAGPTTECESGHVVAQVGEEGAGLGRGRKRPGKQERSAGLKSSLRIRQAPELSVGAGLRGVSQGRARGVRERDDGPASLGRSEAGGELLLHVLVELFLVLEDVALPDLDLLVLAQPHLARHLPDQPEVVRDQHQPALERVDRLRQ